LGDLRGFFARFSKAGSTFKLFVAWISVDFAWILGRFCVDSRSILRGFSVDSRSILGRFSVDSRSILRGFFFFVLARRAIALGPFFGQKSLAFAINGF
jgi:hypothetical protein